MEQSPTPMIDRLYRSTYYLYLKEKVVGWVSQTEVKKSKEV